MRGSNAILSMGTSFSFKGKLSDFKPLAGQQAIAKQRHLNLVRNVPLSRLPIDQVTKMFTDRIPIEHKAPYCLFKRMQANVTHYTFG